MPPLPAVPQVARLDLTWSSAPNTNIHTHMFMDFTGSINVTDANTWANTLFNTIGNNWKTHMSSFVILTSLQLTDLSSSTGVQVVHNGAINGLLVSTPVANSVCVVTEWEIARRYRGGKARTYWPGATLSATFDTESWDPAFIANWKTDFQAMLTALDVAGPGAITLGFPTAVSYYSGFTTVLRPPLRPRIVNTLRVNPLVDPITGVEVRSKFGTQRRRLQAS